MKEQLILWHKAALQYWAARNKREQQILIAGGIVLLIALYLLSLFSVQGKIEALRRRLPELAMYCFEFAAGRFNGPVAPVKRGEDLRSEVFRILAEQGVKAELRGLSPERVEMNMSARAGQNLVNSLNAIRLSAGARVSSLQIRTLESGEQAEATVILERRR